MKKGFTLLEMLIVIGIIAVLTGASIVGYSQVLRTAENARARELVSQVATAFTGLFDSDGVWPKAIREAKAAPKGGGKLLDSDVAYCLQSRLSVSTSGSKASGYERFGIVTPWAQAVLKRKGSVASETTPVSGSSTVSDHILHFEVDLDGDGVIDNVQVGGQGSGMKSMTISVRATAIVWCCDKDGNILDYATGHKKGGIYSWSYGQTQSVK